MRNLRNLGLVMVIVAVVLMAGMVTEVVGDDVYTTSDFVFYIGSGYSATSTYYALTPDFTFDGLPSEDIYIVGLSRFPDGEVYLNAAGLNFSGGGGFKFKVYGNGVFTPVLEMYVIVDNGDKELFSVNTITGQLNLGLDGDQVFTSESISINGGAFGDFSIINYDPAVNTMQLTSVAIETPPIVLTSPENTTTSILPSTPLVWQGKAGSEFNAHLYDDKGGPVYVFPDLTDTSLDVSEYLDWNTTYNWQVDEVIGGEVTYSSPVWTFTTIDYKCQEDVIGDLNGDCVVDFVDFAMFAENWLVEVLKVPDN